MLAGAAFARSDLSPLTGVTVLRFVPGYGLVRAPLGAPETDPDELSAASHPSRFVHRAGGGSDSPSDPGGQVPDRLRA